MYPLHTQALHTPCCFTTVEKRLSVGGATPVSVAYVTHFIILLLASSPPLPVCGGTPSPRESVERARLYSSRAAIRSPPSSALRAWELNLGGGGNKIVRVSASSKLLKIGVIN